MSFNGDDMKCRVSSSCFKIDDITSASSDLLFELLETLASTGFTTTAASYSKLVTFGGQELAAASCLLYQVHCAAQYRLLVLSIL